jgi:hypothetical protein
MKKKKNKVKPVKKKKNRLKLDKFIQNINQKRLNF